MQTLLQIIRKKIPLNLREYYRFHKNKFFKRIFIKQWEKAGYPIPPPHAVKQEVIKKYAEDFNIKVLVETGTYLGDMIAALKNNFDLIYSIELGHDLWLNAKKRFEKDKHIILIEGDSGTELKNIVSILEQPSIYWLDGHYSEGITAKGDKICPIYPELDAIFNKKIKGNIILVDDARLFNGVDDYPLIEDLINYIKNINKKCEIIIKHDIIRIIT